MTAAVLKVFAVQPAEFDPRKYLGPARDNMEKLYKHKIVNVLGSEKMCIRDRLHAMRERMWKMYALFPD